MTLAEILGNKELGDDVSFQINGQDVKLGDLRGVAAERDQYRTNLEGTARERDQLRGDFDNLSRNVTALLGKADEAATGADRNREQPVDLVGELVKRLSPADPSDQVYNDWLFGKAFQRLRGEIESSYEKRFNEYGERMDKFTADVKNAISALSNAQVFERDNRWYYDHINDIPTGQDGKRLTIEQLKDYGLKNGFVYPNSQVVDFDRALDVLTLPVRQKAQMEEVEKAAYQRGLEAGRTGKAQVLPLFGDRNGGAGLPEGYSTKGKSARQMVAERIGQGLADLANEASNG